MRTAVRLQEALGGLQEASWRPPWGLLGASRERPGASGRPPGEPLGPPQGRPGQPKGLQRLLKAA